MATRTKEVKTAPVLTAEHIMNLYMAHCLENGKKPESVYIFSKKNGFSEKEFYKFYASFEVIEKQVFIGFHQMALGLMAQSVDMHSLGFRENLLTYYYTLFEILTANRSYVIYALQGEQNRLDGLMKLRDFRKEFKEFIEGISQGYLKSKSERVKKVQQDALNEGAWVQLMVTLKFWMDDESAGFEKTDLFIEKSIRATFDLFDVTPLESVIDFGKFLFKEKLS
ncbi:TetR family transcriptional regulator C-terminal domain-containing protein [Dyadobacter tibetensis]|uniref:TetR family transcriptional regulator C-terminal domain-containing protein n=1 Tax=Dyadobacter tibetensis TaxID=1211851 RepID=UPI00047244D0|nr:TetR family transcriptional regulator C-terminal domain-containing protein [Dyadobacter tibetensis]